MTLMNFYSSAYQSLKTKAIAIEAQRTAMKGEIEAIADAIARVDKKATAALREKRESWQAISVSKQNMEYDVNAT